MFLQLINIGFGNIASASKIVSIVSPESAPIKRVVAEAKERGQLIDATYGRRTRSVLVMDSGYAILSALQPETIANRFAGSQENREKQDEHSGNGYGGNRSIVVSRE